MLCWSTQHGNLCCWLWLKIKDRYNEQWMPKRDGSKHVHSNSVHLWITLASVLIFLSLHTYFLTYFQCPWRKLDMSFQAYAQVARLAGARLCVGQLERTRSQGWGHGNEGTKGQSQHCKDSFGCEIQGESVNPYRKAEDRYWSDFSHPER